MHLQSRTFLFTGEGPLLRVLDYATRKFLVETQIFHSQCIHGITVYSSCRLNGRGEELTLLVWGGRSVRVVQAAYAEGPPAGHDALDISCPGLETRCSDWILNAAFHPPGSENDDGSPWFPSAVLVTAHNELLILRVQYDPNVSPKYQVLIRNLVAGARSILYCAHVLWLSPTHVVVAAGTVFREVLLWSCRSKRTLWNPSYSTVYLHHKFTGHDGSIFGVHISPELTNSSLGYPRRLLASCSDDRQIRIWQVPDLDAPIATGQASPENDTSEARGVAITPGHNVEEVLQPGKCIASVWAHVSRIWSVRFLPQLQRTELPGRSIDLISLGEDATAQRWSLTLRNQSPGTVQRLDDTNAQLKHISTWDFHSGKNLWSSALTAYGPSSWVLITGGADGKIVSCEIPQRETAALRGVSMDTSIENVEISDGYKHPTNTLHDPPDASLQHNDVGQNTRYQKPTVRGLPSQHQCTQPQTSASKMPKLDSYEVKRYAFVDRDSLLATTVAGQIIVGSLCSAYCTPSGRTSQTGAAETSTSVTWNLIQQFDGLASYSMLVGVPAYRMAFLGGTDGTIYGYDHETRVIHPFFTVHRKVSGLYAQVIPQYQHAEAKEGQVVGLVAAVLGSSTAHSWLVQRQHEHNSKGSVEVLRSWNLDLLPGFLITSAQFMLSANLLLLGSRNGAMTVYDLLDPDETVDNLCPWACFSQLHGDDALTAIMAVPQPPSQDRRTNLHILTTGRNGTYSIHRLYYQQHAESKDEVCLQTVHIASPPMGRNIEGACLQAVSRDLILWGFRGKHFVVWNESKQMETMSIECGGSHREWSYLYHDHDGGSLVWTKASKLNLYRQLEPSHHVIKEGGHGREIKAVAIFTPRNVTDRSPTSLIVTGAEDTSLRLFIHQNDATTRNNPEFRCSGVFRKHTTGIQQLQWCGNAGFLFSSGGFEEFFVWRARSVPGFGFGMVCEAECPALGVSLDLRVMSFHVLDMADKSAAVDQQACFLICVIYSDSTIRVSYSVEQTR